MKQLVFENTKDENFSKTKVMNSNFQDFLWTTK
jgi:hypothetical protein